jgi:type I restriction enzyme S subunit
MGAEWYRRFLHMGVAGGNGALGNLDSKALRDYDLLVPNQGERKAIGALFQKLDSLIALHQRELEILKNLKKAMLEKMFV